MIEFLYTVLWTAVGALNAWSAGKYFEERSWPEVAVRIPVVLFAVGAALINLYEGAFA